MSLVLAKTTNMAEKEWLEARRMGIGGSDVSAICGLNKYKSPMEVYLDKVGALEKNTEQSEAAYWGNVLEEVVAKEFSARTGRKVRNKNAMLQHKDYPWMLANLDRVVVGEKAILECKTASAYLKDEWDGEEIPEAYILQVQHYLAVTGYEKAYLACLVGGQKFVHKSIDRDEEVIQTLIDIEKDFWINHVEKKIPPDIDGSEASNNILKLMYPKATDDEIITLDDEIGHLIDTRINLKKNEEEIKIDIAEIENKIKNLMGEHSLAKAGNFKISWGNYITNRFDTKAFKEKHPDLYKQYINETSARRFSIKELKEAK